MFALFRNQVFRPKKAILWSKTLATNGLKNLVSTSKAVIGSGTLKRDELRNLVFSLSLSASIEPEKAF
jgi:hypothetical protein